MPYCMYLRKSRADFEAEMRGEGETLARHETALLELSKYLNIDVTKIYREVVSGETIASRPEMQRLLADVEQGMWDGVLVMEVERLARGDTMDQGFVAQAFKYSSTKIITPIKTYDPSNEFDEEYFEFGLFMSRREYKTTNRRLQRGRIASVREGKYVSSRPPYGYVRKKLEHDKGYTLEAHNEQAKVVRLIFELCTLGELQEDGSRKRLGISLIVRKLNSLKIPPQRGDVWVPASVLDILRNPVYIGKVRWNCRPAVKKVIDGRVLVQRPRANVEDCIIAEGLHEGIIDADMYAAAQELIKSNPPASVPDKYTVKNPIAGIVICGKCSRRMVRRPYRPYRDQDDTLMCPSTACDNVSVALHYVEEQILKSLSDWLHNYKLQWKIENTAKKDSIADMKITALESLEAELKVLEKQRSNVHDLLERGIYDADTFLNRIRELGERLKQLHAERENIEKDLKFEEAREASQQVINPKVESLLEVYDELQTPKEKNDLLKDVLEKVVYIKEKNGRWVGSPEDFEITLYPKLPYN